jgi:uncharacterized membrane protein
MGVKQAVLAGVMATGLLLSAAEAQTALAAGGLVEAAAPVQEAGAGLSHSALKGLTYMAAITASDVAVLSVASGGVAAGTALTLFSTAASLTVYAVNDFVWGRYEASVARQEADPSFDLQEEFWLTSDKFFTYTLSTLWIKAIKLASLYAYTVSAGTSLVATSVSVLLNAGYFYANNILWDYHDKSAVPPPAPAPQPLVAPPEVAVLPGTLSNS